VFNLVSGKGSKFVSVYLCGRSLKAERMVVRYFPYEWGLDLWKVSKILLHHTLSEVKYLCNKDYESGQE